MAASDLSTWQSSLPSLLSSVLGTSEDQDTSKDVKQTDSGTQTGTSTQAQTGGTTSSTTSNANIADLQSVFNKQAAGITPAMLSAIFTEGSKAVPGLITAQANAVGARASDNTPLATSLTDLQSKLTGQAATINQQMLSDSATTAGKIADLTKGTSTTGTSTGGTTTTNNSATGSTSNQTSSQNLTDTKGVDASNLKLLAALGIGGSALTSLLGGQDGVGSLLQAITGTGANANGGFLNTLKNLISGNGGTSQIPDGMFDSDTPTNTDLINLFGGDPDDQDITDILLSLGEG